MSDSYIVEVSRASGYSREEDPSGGEETGYHRFVGDIEETEDRPKIMV